MQFQGWISFDVLIATFPVNQGLLLVGGLNMVLEFFIAFHMSPIPLTLLSWLSTAVAYCIIFMGVPFCTSILSFLSFCGCPVGEFTGYLVWRWCWVDLMAVWSLITPLIVMPESRNRCRVDWLVIV